MAKLHTETLTFYDWHEVAKEVEKNTKGRKIRDWEGMFGQSPSRTDVEYHDFWHKFIEYVDIHNGAIVTVDFDEMASYFKDSEPKNSKWIRAICNEFIKVVGKGEHAFKVEW